jgi:molecular chaperone Hsp33
VSDVTSDPSSAGAAPTDDIVLPFMIERSSLRGRFVRLGHLLDDILGRHDYPTPVAELLGETITLACLLSSGLKFDGIFTLQISGDGPVGLIVADVTSGGQVRGYARYNGDPLPPPEGCTMNALIGDGRMAFTVDQGEDMDRYQGIVALTGPTLADSFRHYFQQSEQLDVEVAIAVGLESGQPNGAERKWRAGAIMVQRLPDQEKIVPVTDREEQWSRALIFLRSASRAELIDRNLKATELLFRLFHEDGVRVFEPQPYHRGCRCSRDRIIGTLASFPPEERENLKIDGKIEVVCEFCSTAYDIDDREIADKQQRGTPSA